MNILNVTTITEWRGGDNQMYTIFKLLQDMPDVNQFILCPKKSVLAGKCKQDGNPYYTYNKNKFKLINAVKAIVKVCRKEAINIVHIHDSSALNAGLIASKYLPDSVKLVFSRKRDNPIKDKFLNRYKYSHPRIVKIISVSKAVEAVFNDVIKDKERLVTIYDAIDVAQFAKGKNTALLHKEFNLTDDTLIIGNIAGLTQQKDFITFIDTAGKVLTQLPKTTKVKFVIIGDGPLREKLIHYTEEKGLTGHIIFAGFRNNIQELLPEFDIFLMTSVTEGLPLTIYEAFASKIPVVSTNAGGIGEVLLHEQTGLIANIKDTDTLAENVVNIINDKELATAITNNAFNLVSKNHDLDVLKQNYYTFYKNIISGTL